MGLYESTHFILTMDNWVHDSNYPDNAKEDYFVHDRNKGKHSNSTNRHPFHR